MIKEYYTSRLTAHYRDLSCLLVNDLFQAFSAGLNIVLLKTTGSRLSGFELSTKYCAASALTVQDNAIYYYILITKHKKSTTAFSLVLLLELISFSKKENIFLALSTPEPRGFNDIDLFFRKGCVFDTPEHWDYCLPCYELPPMLEQSTNLAVADFIMLEEYFKLDKL